MRSRWRAVAPMTGMLALAIACRDAREAGGLLGGVNIYSATGANALAPEAARARPLVYVPNSRSRSVSVIDPAKHAVVWTIPTGKIPQHVVPSWDLRTLWILNNSGNTVKPIDPISGRDGPSIPVDDPYNMYFTPDGKAAIVVAEAHGRLDFRDPHTMALQQSVPVECRGLDHMEFTADGKFAIATCEFSGELVKVDLDARKVVGYLGL
ncbi:MAG TPA: YncE family protein, partial [Gemmatimonadaceae bacterium]